MPNIRIPTDPLDMDEFKHYGPHYANPDVTAEPMIFPGAK
jgi:hypothetical protein